MKFEIENELDTVIKNTGVIIFLRKVEDGWPVEFVSEKISCLGYTPNDFFSKRIFYENLIYGDDLERVRAEFTRHCNNGDVDFTLEYRILTGSGDVRLINDRVLMRYGLAGTTSSYFSIITDLSDKINSRETIRQKLKIEETLLEISKMFIIPENIDMDINVSLEKIGELCGAGRTYIFEFCDNESFMSNSYEWCAPGVESQIDILQNCPSNMFPWWINKLHNDEIIHITDVSALPPGAEAEKELLGMQGIRSLIVLPLYKKGKLSGFIGMDNVINVGNWKKDDISVLRIVSNLIGMGIQRRKAEKAIHKGEELYRSMFHDAANLITLVDKNGVIIDCNKRIVNVLGYRREELIGKPMSSIMHTGFQPITKIALREISEKGFSFNREYRMVRKDKTIIDINVNSSGLKDETGKHVQTISIIEDITKRKKADKLLQESESRYRSLFQNNSAVILLINPDTGCLVNVNPAACLYYGYTREQMLHMKSTDINTLPEKQVFRMLHQAKSKELNHFFFIHRLSNGDLRDVENYSYPIVIDNNKYLYTIITDITDYRKIQSELIKAKIEAEAANRAKSDFLASMSHELRTPLNAVIGFSDLLLTRNFGELNEKQVRQVGNISKSGTHLLNLINGILDLSKVEAGKMEFNLEQFSISDLIEEVRILLAPLASKKNIHILCQVDEKLTSIKADRTKFKQILYNLVDNAIKFTPEDGFVSVSAQMIDNEMQLSITDTGIGISEHEIQKVFQPFVQVGKFESRAQPGTGLGLALVKKFVEMHRGKIWVESKLGEGSMFSFTFPN